MLNIPTKIRKRYHGSINSKHEHLLNSDKLLANEAVIKHVSKSKYKQNMLNFWNLLHPLTHIGCSLGKP